MGKHSFRQLKIKGTRKPYQKSSTISEENKKLHRIKHLQKYQRTIEKSSLTTLPHIIQNLYSYLAKKRFINIETFIKEHIHSQINIFIKAYRNNYNPHDYLRIENQIKKEIAKNFNTLPLITIKQSFKLPLDTPDVILENILRDFETE